MEIIVVVVVVIVAALAGFIAMRPSEFRIARSRQLSAPAAVVHTHVDDFHKWPEWSPWERIDPAMKREVSGTPVGTGATYYWSGNNKAGEGRMTITDSRPPHSVTIRLEFLRPWKATNEIQFDLVPNGSGTDVIWAMSGHNNFMPKAMGLVMNMEKLVGPDFEKGLAELDTVTAAAPQASAAATPTS